MVINCIHVELLQYNQCIKSANLGETKKMNMFQAINDAMSIALTTDETAGMCILYILFNLFKLIITNNF